MRITNKKKNGIRRSESASFNEALWSAAGAGDIKTVEALIRGGADVHAAQEETGWTALHHAASGGSGNMIRLLLKHGANLNAKDSDGETPLYRAVHCYIMEEAQNRASTVYALLDAGAHTLPGVQASWTEGHRYSLLELMVDRWERVRHKSAAVVAERAAKDTASEFAAIDRYAVFESPAPGL